jgi:hypothetical protein
MPPWFTNLAAGKTQQEIRWAEQTKREAASHHSWSSGGLQPWSPQETAGILALQQSAVQLKACVMTRALQDKSSSMRQVCNGLHSE